MKNLAAKLLSASKIIGNIGKNGTNSHFNFRYQSWEDVVPAVRDACAEVGVMILPTATLHSVEGKRTRVNMAVKVVETETGESMDLSWIGEAYDAQDKGMQKALTSGYKYFLLKLFLIPVRGEHDPDAEAGGPYAETVHNAHELQAEHAPRRAAAAPIRTGGDSSTCEAFGFRPEREPFWKSFGEPPTEKQKPALERAALDRGVSVKAIPWLLAALASAVGREGSGVSKGGLSLAMDFLKGATDGQLGDALEAALELKEVAHRPPTAA